MSIPGSLNDLAMLGRMARDVPAFLRTPMTVERAAELMAARLATRDERFLAMTERTIYANPRSPYLALLRMAGCEPGDLRSLVRREGVEGALRELAAAGVYVTFDELKGRAEAVRGSQRFRFADVEFDSPATVTHLRACYALWGVPFRPVRVWKRPRRRGSRTPAM